MADYTADMANQDLPLIEAALKALSNKDRQHLDDSLRWMDEGDSFGEWHTPAPKEGVSQWPYLVYSDRVKHLTQALYDVGLVVSFDWNSWGHAVGTDSLPTEDPIDAVKTITTILRAERFNDGFKLKNCESGHLQAAVRTVVACTS